LSGLLIIQIQPVMPILHRSQSLNTIRCVSGTLLSLMILASPATILAHAGHGDEFKGGSDATQANSSIQVDAQTAQQLGIKVEPVKRQQLAIGIKTTGQIETLPNQKVEITTPTSGDKVVELLVQPGSAVTKGQPLAVLTSPDLVELRVNSQEKLAQGQADLQQAQADLKLSQQNYERYQQIAASEIAQTQSRVAFAQEKYHKDKQLADVGALPRRTALESQTQLAEAKFEVTKASTRRDVIAAEAQLKRSQSAVTVAQTRISLSNSTYQTRLQQLGTRADAKGLVTVTSPISGRVAGREATPGQSFKDPGEKLMSIVNDTQVLATANIYEKDLNKIQTGQQVNVKIAALPDRIFTGRITVIGSVVEGETRVVPVKTQIDNVNGVLKPGMFAELEVLTDKTPTSILAIPSSAVVEANGKKLVYVQSGDTYRASEVNLGQTSGNMVEVKSGLFEGDLIVTQRAPQLYAQSLRGGSKEAAHTGAEKPSGTEGHGVSPAGTQLPSWLIGVGGGLALSTVAFIAGMRAARRQKLVPVAVTHIPESPRTIEEPQSPTWNDNHQVKPESQVTNHKL
jgi:membrane fusion protein, heavy metal efflux system